MPLGIHGFIGDRLKEAREARGMSAASLADCVGVSRQSISQYETGRQSPTVEVLERIASTLSFPIGRFTLDASPTAPDVVFNRSMSSATKTARTRVVRRVGWLFEALRMMQPYVGLPEVDFPTAGAIHDPTQLSSEDVESIAENVRAEWNLRDGPIGNLVWLLESHGAIVVRHEMLTDSLDAMSMWSSEFERPVIVLGADKGSSCRSRFDAAHELAHLVLHRHVDATRLNVPSDFKMIEEQAHRFAAAFLMQERSFTKELYAPTLQGMLSLKSRWRVAISAMIQRSRQLGLIDDDYKQRLFIQMSRRRWRIREPLDDRIPIEEPRLVPRSVQKLIEAGVFAPADFPSHLGLSEHDLTATLCLEDGFFNNPSLEDDPTEPRIVQFPRRKIANVQ